ncbi:MAG: hypothetical protein CHACPFDD_03811 [Phycisphaerae bacterium]|nr:hypothetical protein [Phycisphaerae bacterium]
MSIGLSSGSRVWLVRIVAACCVFGLAMQAHAQHYVMMPDSTNNRLVLFDPFDGSLVNSNAFPLAAGTPIHAMQVGSEVWVSEQIGDRISRWDFTGTPLGAITGTLDNVRGMGLLGGTVYLCNDGTGNGAPGPSLHMFTPAGGSLGFFLTPSTTGPFGILDYPGGMLVSSDASNDDIHKYSLTGTSLGTFHNSTSLNFVEQLDYATNGDVLAAVFSSNIVARLDPVSGALLSSFSASGARGVYQLGNGDIMWTNSSGAHVFDPDTGGDTLVYAGGGRFLDDFIVPEPASVTLLAAATLLVFRRRRS